MLYARIKLNTAPSGMVSVTMDNGYHSWVFVGHTSEPSAKAAARGYALAIGRTALFL